MAKASSNPTSIGPATAVESISFGGSTDVFDPEEVVLVITDTKSELLTQAGIEKIIQRFIKLYMS